MREPNGRVPGPLEEFLAEVPPQEVHEAILEFQTNWCDHKKNRDEATSNPVMVRCLDCNILWLKGNKPKKGEITDEI